MLLIDLAWKTTWCWSSGNQELLAQCVVLTVGRGGGGSEGRTTKSRTFLFLHWWMDVTFAIHLALVKHSHRQIGEGRSECTRFLSQRRISSNPVFSFLLPLFPPLLPSCVSNGGNVCGSVVVDTRKCMFPLLFCQICQIPRWSLKN